MNTSLGAIPEMSYCNKMGARTADTPIKAHARMKWFRSKVKLGSRLALFALAIQLLLSFGHFHGSSVQAAFASADAKRSGLHHAIGFAAMHVDALDRTSHPNVSGAVRLKTPSGHEPAGQPTDDCAICAVMALANAVVVAAPPYLLGPQADAVQYLTADAGFVDLNSARVAFQPRAPPVA
jgi:hypothetical protein